MAWAEATAYSEAVQNPRVAFRDAELQDGELATNLLGLPLVHTGNFAAVFQLRRPAGPPDWALKCFTRQVHGLRRRYQAIHTHLNGRRLPFMVQFAYQADGILVGTERYPLLKMDWVEGQRLDQFLGDCLTRPGAKGVLRRLSQMWLRLSVMLREAEVGHGDLQHGNVMLVPVPGSDALALKLIDYDGMYVPELSGHAPGEIGHPAYQHPGRSSKTGYGPEVDRFSHLVIYTTLQALIAGGLDLWQPFYNGDRLLLGPDDFRDPGNSEAFRTLWQMDKPDVRALTGHLALAASGPVDAVPLLSELVSDTGVVPLTEEQQTRASGMLGFAAKTPGAVGEVLEVAEVGRDDSPVEAELVPEVVEAGIGPAEAAAGRRSLREWMGGLISGADRMLVRVVGEENTILLGFVRPLAALAGLALAVVVLLMLWQVGLQLATREWASPESPVASSEAGVPAIIPAVYRVRLVPVEALLTASGMGVTIEGEGSERTVTVVSPDGETRLVLVAVLEGYEHQQLELQPVPGETESVAITMSRLPTITNSIGMRLQLIPAGEFLMGSADSDREAPAEEKPQHRVRITEPFYLAICEVTQSQWEQVMGSNPSQFKGPDHPVERVSWEDCQKFIRRLNNLPGERGGVYRLPTEAEWEYACGAGSTTVYSFGYSADLLGDYAWYRGNSGRRTHPVGQKRPNAWGLHDMHGNVWEWCQDWHDSGYYRSSPLDDPQGPTGGSNRVYRGGSWDNTARHCRSANRDRSQPSFRFNDLGFRLACSSVE
jgi:formylglycine-generating enzyme required for sulfatase activity